MYDHYSNTVHYLLKDLEEEHVPNRPTSDFENKTAGHMLFMRRFLSSSIAEVNSPSYQASSTYCVTSFWLYMSGPNSFYLYPTLTHSWMGMKTQLDRYDTTGLEDGVWSHMLIGYT